MANTIKGLLPSGKAPSALKAEVIELIKTEATEPDLTAYVKSEVVDAKIAGIQSSVQEMLASAAAIAVGGGREPGKWHLNTSVGAEVTDLPPTPNARTVTPTAPLWEITESGLGTWLGVQEGVIYRPATGEVPPGSTASVTAYPDLGYRFPEGAQTHFTHRFPEKVLPAPYLPEGLSVVISDSFFGEGGLLADRLADAVYGGSPAKPSPSPSASPTVAGGVLTHGPGTGTKYAKWLTPGAGGDVYLGFRVVSYQPENVSNLGLFMAGFVGNKYPEVRAKFGDLGNDSIRHRPQHNIPQGGYVGMLASTATQDVSLLINGVEVFKVKLSTAPDGSIDFRMLDENLVIDDLVIAVRKD